MSGTGQHPAMSATDKKLLFPRPPLLGAARVRENWFLAAHVGTSANAVRSATIRAHSRRLARFLVVLDAIQLLR